MGIYKVTYVIDEITSERTEYFARANSKAGLDKIRQQVSKERGRNVLLIFDEKIRKLRKVNKHNNHLKFNQNGKK